MFFYTLFDQPKDYPRKYVIRLFFNAHGKSIINRVVVQQAYTLTEFKPYFIADNMEDCLVELRRLGLFPLGRNTQDDVNIVGVWI
jgi:hypothetical protein